MNPALYAQQKECPVCLQKLNVLKVRSSACPVTKRDADFCVHYGGTINPNYYAVWVCPVCGYAGSDTTFEALEPRYRSEVAAALRGRGVPPGSQGERGAEGAIAAYEQALYLAEARRLVPTGTAGLHLKLAWIYREQGQAAKEQEELVKARDGYRYAFDHERLGGPGKMSETTVAYLIGELNRRTGEMREAINWFSRLATDPRTKEEPQILNLAREQWYIAKNQATEGDESSAAEGAGSGGSTADANQANGGEEDSADVTLPGAAGALRMAGPHNRLRETKITANISLCRDQVEWLRTVVNSSDAVKGRLELAEVVRAVLDVAVLNLEPSKLVARDDAELRVLLGEAIVKLAKAGGKA